MVGNSGRNDDGRYESCDWNGMKSNAPANIEVFKMVQIRYLLPKMSSIRMDGLFPYTKLLRSTDLK